MAPKKGKIKEEADIKPEDDDEDVGKKKNRPARAKKPTKKAKEADDEAMADDSGDDFDPEAEGEEDDDGDSDLEDEVDEENGDEEQEEEEEEEDSEEDEDEGAKKKKKPAASKKAPAKKAAPAKKKPAARKRKAASEDEEDEDEDEDDGGKKKRKGKGEAAAKKRKTSDKVDLIAQAREAKKTAAAEKERLFDKPKSRPKDPVVLHDGWTAHPPSLLYKNWESKNSEKVAAFDFDGTLVITKSGADFPRDEHDWLPYNKDVYGKLKKYHDQGYKIVIFSNAGNVRGNLDGPASDIRRNRVSHFQAACGVPLAALLATDKDAFRKPGTGMWDFMCDNLNGGVKPSVDQSFFVGDSIDGGDEGFAQALGLQYRDEKQEFGGPSKEAGAAVDAGAAAAAGPSGTGGGEGKNPELVSIFRRLAELAKSDPKPFKRIAMQKVADTLELFDKKVTNDPKVLKEVSNLKGVGKGSIAIIKEYLETGNVAALHGDKSLPAGKVQKEALEDAGAADALKYM